MKRIPLTQGKFAFVDGKDYERVSQFKWFALKARMGFYAARNLRKPDVGTQLLHVFLMGRKWVDHKDGDGLNCQQGNLRPATPQQNQRAHKRKKCGASSQYRGVHKHSSGSGWVAKIKVGVKQTYLGFFKFEEAAARAYDRAAKKYFGRFAAPNFSARC